MQKTSGLMRRNLRTLRGNLLPKRLATVLVTMVAVAVCIVSVYLVVNLALANIQRVGVFFESIETPPNFDFPSECTEHFGTITYQDGVRGILPTLQWLGNEKEYGACSAALVAHEPVEFEIGEIHDLWVPIGANKANAPTSLEDIGLSLQCASFYVDDTQTHEKGSFFALKWTGTDADWENCFRGTEEWHDYLAGPTLEFQGIRMRDFYIRP